MNHIYRLIWSDIARTWVAVAETAMGRGKRASAIAGTAAGTRTRQTHCLSALDGLSHHLQILAASLALIGAPAYVLDPNALPAGGRVTAGSAAISQVANVLNVKQTSQRAALDWQSFNIGAATTVNFKQPNSSAVALKLCPSQ